MSSSKEYFKQGVRAQQTGNIILATDCYLQVLKIDENHVDALNNLGIIAKSKHKNNDALGYFNKAVRICQDHPLSNYNLAVLMFENGNLKEADILLNKCMNLKLPTIFALMTKVYLAEIHDNPLIAYDYLQQILKLNSNRIFLEKYAQIALKLGKEREGNLILQKLASEYDQLSAKLQLASINLQQGNLYDACSFYKLALCQNLNNTKALSMLYYCYRKLCDFKAAEQISKQLDNENIYEEPFSNIIRVAKTKNNYENLIKKENIKNLPNLTLRQHNKIRIGYLSSDFKHHATMYLLQDLFQMHDQRKFEIYIYSHTECYNDSFNTSLQSKYFYFDVSHMNSYNCAGLIKEHELDILIDLKGHTHRNRLSVFKYRPAPIQISYLGFPGSTGINEIDYLIADNTVIPEYEQKYYYEKIKYLRCYQLNTLLTESAPKKTTRCDFNFPGGVLIGSFNQSFKFSESYFSIVTNILLQSNAKFVLIDESKEITANIKKYFNEYGLIDRIIFCEILPRRMHLARLSHIDLVLDTLDYNGHTSTTDALIANTPVITLSGNNFASRVSHSIYKSLEYLDLVTYSFAEYTSLALDLVSSPNKLHKIRTVIHDKKELAKLQDQKIKEYEDLLCEIYNAHLNQDIKIA